MIAVLLLVVAAALLVSGAELFVENAAGAARRLGVTVIAVGVLLAGAEPEELLTAVIAAVQDRPGLPPVTRSGQCHHAHRDHRVGCALPAAADGAPGAPVRAALRGRRGARRACPGRWHVSRMEGGLLLAAYVGLVALVWWREKEPPVLGEMAEMDDDDEEAAARHPASRWAWRSWASR